MGAVPDLLNPGLKVLFIGINPGLRSGETGHHFAGRSNRFWHCLAKSGLTTQKLTPHQDGHLLELGYGITNLASRVTASEADLTPEEMRAGAVRLMEVLRQYHPRVAAYLGKVVYRYLAHKQSFAWGLQQNDLVPGVIDFVMPNPSGLNRMPIEEQLVLYRELAKLVDRDM